MLNELTRREAIKITALMMGAAAVTSGCTSLDLQTSSSKSKKIPIKPEYEVLIIGGGPAGLTAAMTLGRMSRSVLLCDDNRPRNFPSTHVNNFPSDDGIHPADWRRKTRKNLEKYKTVETADASVLSVVKNTSGFTAQLSSGETVFAKKLILAYGVVDTLPPIPGFKELWGKSIFHCPYCHGYEARDLKLGFFSSHPMAFHMVPMLHDLALHLTLFTNGKSPYTSEQVAILKQKKIDLVESKVSKLDYEQTSIKSVVLEDGKSVELQGLFFFPNEPFRLKSQIGELLGCERTEFGFYKVNERNQTTVSGVYACGDNMSMAHSVLLAAASGVTAGANVVYELLSEKLTS